MSRVRPRITDAVRADFDASLARTDQESAVALTVGLVEDGVRVEDVLLGLIAPAQVAVGARWESDEWSVAHEHAATHVSEVCVTAVSRGTVTDGSAGEVVVACGDGEWHTLPARILSEVLRLRGFAVRFLGGHVPAAQLVADLHQNGPDVVALSCSLPTRLPQAHRQVEVCRLAGIPVLAGGPGFGPDGVWARTLGADLYAPGATQAADLLHHRWPPPSDGVSSVDAASFAAYSLLATHRSELLRHMVGRLDDRFLAGRRYEPTTETLGNLLDSLAAGVFVDDLRVLTGALSFTAAYLAARSVHPGPILRSALGTLKAPLRDSPRCLAHTIAGQEWLDLHPNLGAAG